MLVIDKHWTMLKRWQWTTGSFFGISRYCCPSFWFICPKGRPFCSRNIEILILFKEKLSLHLVDFQDLKLSGNYEIVIAVTKIVVAIMKLSWQLQKLSRKHTVLLNIRDDSENGPEQKGNSVKARKKTKSYIAQCTVQWLISFVSRWKNCSERFRRLSNGYILKYAKRTKAHVLLYIAISSQPANWKHFSLLIR